MKVLAFGSRTFTDGRIISSRLDQAHANIGITTLIEGDARGADKLAGIWASVHKIERICVPADWSTGRSAGYIRNQIMVIEHKPEMAFGFLDGPSSGSMHTVQLCLQHGVPLYIVDSKNRCLKRPINVAEVLAFLAS